MTGKIEMFRLTEGESFKVRLHDFLHANGLFELIHYDLILLRILEELRDIRKDLSELFIGIEIIIDGATNINFQISAQENLSERLEVLREELSHFVSSSQLTPFTLDEKMRQVLEHVKS
jgi:hypothetical protein